MTRTAISDTSTTETGRYRLDRNKIITVEADELIQRVERQLADAEEAYRINPSEANQRKIMSAWSAVRRARGRYGQAQGPACPLFPPTQPKE